ncbi:hypothetical protein [Nocardia sp. CC201C]|uniref:hypothetical protein n=1 Tax=Nocardia sp. CC201C TaxID=3044575 RepID=UPI0024A8E39B|nr:hypothetical protein [Nocardia sp. CC201C]
MPSTCWSSVRGKVARLTKLTNCGAPAAGPTNSLATDGFTSVEYAPEYEDGEESSLKKADGRFAYLFKDDDQIKWVNVNVAFTGVNPDALAMILGQPLVMDHDGNAVGIRVGQVIGTDWALETWTDIPGIACTTLKPYGYFLAPWLHGGRLASFTIQNGAAEFKIENARTQLNPQWGVGPYDVDLQPAVAPDPPAPGKLLAPIAADQHLDMHITYVAPPATACAATALVIP